MTEIKHTEDKDADAVYMLLREAGWGSFSEYQVKGFLKASYTLSLKAIVNENIIGGLGAMTEGDDSMTLEYLVIKKEYRRNGHASKLMNALFDEAKKLGVKKIGLDTLDPKFYERFGFREVGRMQKWEDGKDKVVMLKEMDDAKTGV